MQRQLRTLTHHSHLASGLGPITAYTHSSTHHWGGCFSGRVKTKCSERRSLGESMKWTYWVQMKTKTRGDKEIMRQTTTKWWGGNSLLLFTLQLIQVCIYISWESHGGRGGTDNSDIRNIATCGWAQNRNSHWWNWELLISWSNQVDFRKGQGT